MNKFVSGKISLLVLTSVFVTASFLFLRSLTSVLAFDTFEECGNITEYKTEGVSLDVEDNVDNSRVMIDVHFSPGDGRLISVQAKAGYEIVSTELKVEDDGHSGYINYGGGNKDHFNPDGGDIQEYKINVQKVCETSKTSVCNDESFDNYGGDDGRFDPETEIEDNELCENSEETPGPQPTPGDVCWNLEGFQGGIPDGYHKDSEDGACNQYQFGGAPPPSDGGQILGASTGQVLGASTMAGTGSFSETLYIAIMGLGGLITAAGFKIFRKASK